MTQRVTIIDYGMGNLGSILNMLKKIGASAVVSSDPTVIENADKLVLSGVGTFDSGMKNLAERNLIQLLNERVLKVKVPILGICLGMQLFTKRSQEGVLAGLSWLDAETVSFNFATSGVGLKVPHMGWNTVRICTSTPFFKALDHEPRFYFAHSYHVVCIDPRITLAETEYGYSFPSVMSKENILGVQFHPEKSHRYGMKLLKNFVEHF